MNTRINSYDNNLAFNARYLHINNADKMPLKIYTAIYKSAGVDEFLAAGQPKGFWQHLVDFFKKDEVLSVDYARDCFPVKRFNSGDQFNRFDEVTFSYGKEGTFFVHRKRHYISAEQNGKLKEKNGVKKYEAPDEMAEDIIAKQIEEIKDLDKLLKFRD